MSDSATNRAADLLPCPFCGNEARFGACGVVDGDDNAGAEYVECSGCSACTALVFPTMESAKPLLTERWNRRAACEGAGSIPSEAEERKAFETKFQTRDLSKDEFGSYNSIRTWGGWEAWQVRAALAVPSEGIASVAASEPTDEELIALGESEAMMPFDEEWHIRFGRAAWNLGRAALAASDESLSRQSSEAAESHRSTRKTQGSES